MASPSYPCRHFSVCNAQGPTSNDLPLLLRRLADSIEGADFATSQVLDVHISGDEITEYGSWWRATVYWSADGELAEGKSRN
ncbi:hypothetical protein [Allobranchiibius huperziae]|uniref:Uncharacterized protein n=1 Tax=Allobranchiibius huperziae TaxID=1874116 RepID=A0A853DIM5_9MICO|nr:hypothetical protein [Allobranchiibius huperziae]NYJ75883.1 hypothetical protein [Allobranchiibius huperziae]